MARSETLAIVDDARVDDLVGASVRAPAIGFSRAPSPVNDIGSGARGDVAFDDIEDRFQQAFERKLLGPLSEIAETATLLGDQLSDVQADQLRAVRAAAERQSAMLRDMLAFVRSAMWGPVRVERRRVDLRLLCERVLHGCDSGPPPDRTIVLTSRAPGRRRMGSGPRRHPSVEPHRQRDRAWGHERAGSDRCERGRRLGGDRDREPRAGTRSRGHEPPLRAVQLRAVGAFRGP